MHTVTNIFKAVWAMAMHKAQDLTLSKVVIDVGKNKFSSGLSYVRMLPAFMYICHLKDLFFKATFSYEKLSNLSKSLCLKENL